MQKQHLLKQVSNDEIKEKFHSAILVNNAHILLHNLMKFHYTRSNCIGAAKTHKTRQDKTRRMPAASSRTQADSSQEFNYAPVIDKSTVLMTKAVKQQLLIVIGDSKKHKSETEEEEEEDEQEEDRADGRAAATAEPCLFVGCLQTANNCVDQCRTSHVKDSAAAADNQMSIFYVSKITRPVHYTAAGYDGRLGQRVVPQESAVSDGHGTDQT